MSDQKEIQNNILALSRSKEKCLGEFLQVTQAFMLIPDDELSDTEKGGELVDIYLNQRATILAAVELFDRKLNESIESLEKRDLPDLFISSAHSYLSNCDRLIQSIFDSDNGVFEKMRQAQEKIEFQIQSYSKNREILDRFKSQAKNHSGEGIDRSV